MAKDLNLKLSFSPSPEAEKPATSAALRCPEACLSGSHQEDFLGPQLERAKVHMGERRLEPNIRAAVSVTQTGHYNGRPKPGKWHRAQELSRSGHLSPGA